MAGVQIEVTVENGAQLEAALVRLAALGREPQGLLRAVGQAMVRNTRARFNAGVDPEGNGWTPLNPGYAEGKPGTHILIGLGMSGGLQGSITAQVDSAQVAWGSNKVYAAIHQFGGVIRPKNGRVLAFKLAGGLVLAKSVTIPARPYLGLSEEDRRDLLEVAGGFLTRAMRA